MSCRLIGLCFILNGLLEVDLGFDLALEVGFELALYLALERRVVEFVC